MTQENSAWDNTTITSDSSGAEQCKEFKRSSPYLEATKGDASDPLKPLKTEETRQERTPVIKGILKKPKTPAGSDNMYGFKIIKV